MKKTLMFVRALSPYLQGLLGAATIAVGVYLGIQVRDRWNEFVVMRQVVSQLIENSQKAQQEAVKKADKP